MSGLTNADRSARIAMLSLPALGPVRLGRLLEAYGSDAWAWSALRAGDLTPVRAAARVTDEVAARWRAVAVTIDADDRLAAHRRAGVSVLFPGDADWPVCFADDPEPPSALFVRGDLGAIDGSAVAVVGTRRCTANGAAVARSLGRDLALAGVAVVSGLALGIDGAAHRGAIDAGGIPVAVVGTGLDRVYPSRHARLWAEVADVGVIMSEAALGIPAERWRFPARNRLIAALSGAVVVVESGTRGGSLFTVDAAVERQREVFAVPGPVGAAQSAGTNQLLFDGAAPARDAADVLEAMGWNRPGPASGTGRGPETCSAPATGLDAAVLLALSGAPSPIESVIGAVGHSVAEVSVALARLEAAARIRRTARGYELVIP